MNGIAASIIISGNRATLADIVAVEKELGMMFVAYGPEVEIIIYFDKLPSYQPREKNLVLTSSKRIEAFKNAVVVASGEKIIFTTINNFLADIKNSALNQALDMAIKTIGIPPDNGLLHNFGLRRKVKVPYIITSKNYLLGIIAKSESFFDLLDYAKQKKELVKLPPVAIHFRDYIARGNFFSSEVGENLPSKKTVKNKSATIKFNKDIPTFINCRDRLSSLIKLVNWCEKEGLNNIILIDNKSTYPPLVEYFSNTPHEVIRLNHNVGYLSPWLTGAVDVYAKDRPYIVSDSDVVPSVESHGAVKYFCQLLNRYPKYVKAGFGLKVDDLPKSYEPRDYVIAWEKQYWQKEISKDVYDAAIDTTFALWRPNLSHVYGPSLRTGGRYIAKHTTWYIDSSKLSQEEKYYNEHADKVVSTWSTKSNELPKIYKKARSKIKKKNK